MRVLIADDDHGFRAFMRRVLDKECNLSVLGEAVDGQEAVRNAEELKPELVLMDMDLPHTDGLEATRRVKAFLPSAVVIMFSTVDGPEYRDAAARSGADEFLPKNAEISRILSTIRFWLRRKGAA